jgi:EAL domain-containing protein (putative c-di-GMP-specific phosphodiesterase class I)
MNDINQTAFSSSLPFSRQTEKRRIISSQDLMTAKVLLAYQPIMNVAQDRVCWREGAARLVLADNTVLAPGELSAGHARSKIMHMIDISVLDRLERDLQQNPDLFATINVPIESIANFEWHARFRELVGEGSRFPGRIVVEIDEASTGSMPVLIADFMKYFQRRGVLFALDNFGKDKTSLKNIVDFLFDFIKIDQFFVRDIQKSADKQVIIHAINGIARELDAVCIAEKVETEQEASWLVSAGIQLMQGFYFGRPVYASNMKMFTR